MFVYMTDMFAKVGGATGGDPSVGSSPGSARRRTKARFFFFVVFFEGFGCEHKTRGSLNGTPFFRGIKLDARMHGFGIDYRLTQPNRPVSASTFG